MFIVTNEPSEFPPRRMMVGSGYIVNNGPEEVKKREPTDKDMRIISTKEARRLFGTFANRLDGVTVSPVVSPNCTGNSLDLTCLSSSTMTLINVRATHK